MAAPAPRPAPSLPPAAPRPAGWRALAASFRFAWEGVVETALHQRNMRIHLVAGLLVASFCAAAPLAPAEALALLLCVFLVLAAEVANSALEALVDLVTRERHDLARRAKDAGAGAVLALAAGAVAVLVAVVARAWPALLAARAGLARAAALGLALGGTAALLLAARRPSRAAVGLLTLGGVGLIVGLALATRSGFTALAALLFAVAAESGRRRTGAGPRY